jgi:transcriptional/translational regulatory protein YebC/TACO1
LLEADPEMEFIEDGITFLPKMKVTLEAEDDIKQFQRLLAQLRELDDVEEIYHNVEGMEE